MRAALLPNARKYLCELRNEVKTTGKGTAIWLVAILVASAVLGVVLYRVYYPIPQAGECYAFLSYKILDFPFQYSFDSTVPLEFRAAITAGAEEWDKFVTGDMFQVVATSGNTVSFGRIKGDSLAITTAISSGAALLNAGITFNSNVGWTTSPNPWWIRADYDVQSVATHEMGHILGLGHVSCQTHTMYDRTPPENADYRTLETGDLTGLRMLYA